MSKVGISNFHYALQDTEDTASSPATYGTVKAVPGLVSVDVQTESNQNTLYADNGPYETASSLGSITVNIEMADLPLDVQADLLGHTLDTTTATNPKMTKKASDVAPNAAIMFEFLMGNGKKRAVKLYKGKFGEPNDTGNTRGENIEFQTSSISATFVQLKNNKVYEDMADFEANADTSAWYASVLP